MRKSFVELVQNTITLVVALRLVLDRGVRSTVMNVITLFCIVEMAMFVLYVLSYLLILPVLKPFQ